MGLVSLVLPAKHGRVMGGSCLPAGSAKLEIIFIKSNCAMTPNRKISILLCGLTEPLKVVKENL